MNTTELAPTLRTLFAELVEGAPPRDCYILNPRDPGLLRSLERISASAASATATGGASIAAHVEHLRYGISLMNRWSAGEDPFRDADWTKAWERTTVTDAEWATLRNDLAVELRRWLEVLRTGRDVTESEINAMVGSIAHLAYHLGAIRQIDRTLRGPLATE